MHTSLYEKIVATLQTLLFFRFHDGSHCQQYNFREFAKRVGRLGFGEPVVMATHDERRLQSSLRDNIPPFLDDMNVAQVFPAEACRRAYGIDLGAPARLPFPTSLICDSGKYSEKRTFMWDVETEKSCGLDFYHSEVRQCSPIASDHSSGVGF